MRRVVLLLGTLALLLVGLTACGDDDGDGDNTGKVSVTGDFGSQPKVTYDGEVNRATTDTKVLTEGTGADGRGRRQRDGAPLHRQRLHR